ncbi:MAG: FAD-binding oxidoreductase [Burkholderiaceae bacterium]
MPPIESLRERFAGRLLTDPAETAAHLTDWRGKWTGRAIAVAQPDDTDGVAAIMRWCHAHRVAVVPQGGNTGLSGGATPDGSGNSLVLSLARMRRVRAIDVPNNTITAEAGVSLHGVQTAARDAGRLFPLSLAAEGSCTIGGNLATNAGGVQVLRYGNSRDLCLGLEVVTVDGRVWHGLKGLRKDNTGYDLRDLFIGSEGTLGVITAATLKLFPLPNSKMVAFAAVASAQAAVALLELAQANFADGLTAFELMSDTCIALVEKHVDAARFPLAERAAWYALIELSSTADEAETARLMERMLGLAIERELIVDAAVSTNIGQFRALWALREDISEAQGAEGKTIKHDISLPITLIPDFVEQTSREILERFALARMVVFGHLGDGNLHFNVSPPAGAGPDAAPAFVAQEAALNKFVHDAVSRLGGSISAEHGLGVLRRDEASRYRDPTAQALMQAIKQALDPLGLMNPGKVIVPPAR